MSARRPQVTDIVSAMELHDDRSGIADLAARVAELRAELADGPDSVATRLELVHALTQLADAAPDAGDRAGQADEPIALLRTTAEMADEDLPAVLTELAGLLSWRCLARAEQVDIDVVAEQPDEELARDRDEAISCLDRVWRFTAETGELAEFVAAEFPTVQRVTDMLLLRARWTGAVEDAATAIGYATAVLDALPESAVDRAVSHCQLAIAHSLCGDKQPNDQWPAIPHLRALRDMPAGEHPWHDGATVELGIQLAQRIAHDPAGGLDDLDDAIAQLTRATELTRDDDAVTAEVGTLVRYWLGMTLALRYLAAAGTEDDRTAAIAGLTELIDAENTDPAVADHCRVAVAYLHLAHTLPTEVRSMPAVIDYDTVKQYASRAAPNFLFPEADVEAMSRQLAELSGSGQSDPAIASMSAMFQILSGIGKIAAGQSSPDEFNRVVALLDEELNRGELLNDDDANILTIMRNVLAAHRARESADVAESNRAVDLLIELAGRMAADHPMRRFTQDALGAITDSSLAAPKSTVEVVNTAQRLEKVLDELPDDHPNRVRVLANLASSLLNTPEFGGDMAALTRLRTRLQDMINRPAADEVNAGINHVLLGQVESIQGVLDDDVELMRHGADRYRTAATLLPADHPLAGTLDAAVAALLLQRYSMDGALEHADAATYYGRRGRHPMSHRSATEADRTDNTTTLHNLLPLMDRITEVIRNLDQLTAERLDALASAIDEATAGWPAGVRNPFAELGLGTDGFRWLRGMLGPDGFEFPTSGPKLTEFLADAERLAAEMRDTPTERIDFLDNVAIAAQADIGSGFAARDLARLDRGIGTLAPLCVDTRAKPRQRARFLWGLGSGLNMRYVLSHDSRDLDNAIDRLEEARRFSEQHPGTDSGIANGGGSILHELGRCYFLRSDRARQDRRRAVLTGLASLRGRAEDVLLQTGAQRALEKAMSATNEAAEVTRWCVACGDHESAVHALELGRGMVLHAATVEAGVPMLLREGGHQELADEWEREVARAGTAPWDLAQDMGEFEDEAGITLPSDLRRQVLDAIDGTEIRARLFSPPSVPAIAKVLDDARAGSLVYLLPGDEGSAGLAVLVDDAGSVRAHPLPRLRVTRGGPIDLFEQAQRDWLATGGEPARHRWSESLRELCDWAWPAAMGPVLDQLIGTRPGGAVRLVLVPVGKLGAVPWHAAQRPVHGGRRHAGQDAIISYAASARQFVDATARDRPPWHTNPALVRVLDSALLWNGREMAALRAHCYPECVYLGDDEDDRARPVRPSDIAALLPGPDGNGASVLHLGCHGSYAPLPLDSSLLLDGGDRLYVRDILRHARDRPAGAPGGLVVLATCVSDLTDNAHDEALTLASAFLAAGAVGVVGTRWPVHDLPTALFMIVFHHYLNFGYPHPATALRATQLWMLNPNRRLPPGVDERLTGPMRRAELAAVENWAGFTYQGH